MRRDEDLSIVDQGDRSRARHRTKIAEIEKQVPIPEPREIQLLPQLAAEETASLDLEGGHIRASKRLWCNDTGRLRKQFGQFVAPLG